MPVKELPNTPAELVRNRQNSDFALGTLTSVTVWHDYICPWCYVALIQGKKLAEQFGVALDWRGCELIPPGMDGPPDPTPDADGKIRNMANMTRGQGRFEDFLDAEQIEMPMPRPSFTRSHNALLATEFARENGALEAFTEGVYRAYWERYENIADVSVLARIGEMANLDGAALAQSIEAERFAERILPFDDEAYAHSIRHAPTFLFGGAERLAEANYEDLARAMERFQIRAERIKKNRGLA